MFSLAGALAYFGRVKHPDPASMQHVAEISDERASEETRQDFEAWQRHWHAIEKGIDELVAHLHQEPRT